MHTAIIKYHKKHWWKFWPEAHLTKINDVRVLEILFSRYGFQLRWVKR